jgi:hypothetical protein
VGEDSGVDAVNKKRLYNQVVISFWRPETKINKTICKFNIKSGSLDAGGGDFIWHSFSVVALRCFMVRVDEPHSHIKGEYEYGGSFPLAVKAWQEQ